MSAKLLVFLFLGKKIYSNIFFVQKQILFLKFSRGIFCQELGPVPSQNGETEHGGLLPREAAELLHLGHRLPGHPGIGGGDHPQQDQVPVP